MLKGYLLIVYSSWMGVKPHSRFLWLFFSWDEVLLLRTELHDNSKTAEFLLSQSKKLLLLVLHCWFPEEQLHGTVWVSHSAQSPCWAGADICKATPGQRLPCRHRACCYVLSAALLSMGNLLCLSSGTGDTQPCGWHFSSTSTSWQNLCLWVDLKWLMNASTCVALCLYTSCSTASVQPRISSCHWLLCRGLLPQGHADDPTSYARCLLPSPSILPQCLCHTCSLHGLSKTSK